jgi:hypothetical protein
MYSDIQKPLRFCGLPKPSTLNFEPSNTIPLSYNNNHPCPVPNNPHGTPDRGMALPNIPGGNDNSGRCQSMPRLSIYNPGRAKSDGHKQVQRASPEPPLP